MAAPVETVPIAADDGFEDEGYGESSNTSYLTSLASDIRRGVQENGRTYASFGKYNHGLPIDEQEQDRNDMQHSKFLLLLGDKLHLSPVAEAPSRILDLGTGSGIWAIDMADRYPSATVIGVDVAPVQTTWVPPNCKFEVDDIENDWLFPKNSFDFIFGRELLMSIRDWPRLITQAYDHLKPGGYLELSLTHPRTCCEDGSLDLSTSHFAKSADLFFDMAEQMGTPLDAQEKWKEQFSSAGFEDVQEHIFRIPTGPWAKDKRLKLIGKLELANVNNGYDAFLLRGFTQILGRSEDELQVMIAMARREIFNPKHHVNVRFFVVHGRKPKRPDPSG